ncbi:MAG: hypothetical protein ACR2HJ_00055 [Fimbriimonadales bacterium]
MSENSAGDSRATLWRRTKG